MKITPVARRVFEEVDDTLNQNFQKSLSMDLKINSLTENTQPAIMSVSMALVRVIEYESKEKFMNFQIPY